VVGIGGGFCAMDKARELETFFAPRVADLEGGPRALAQTLESIRLCAALVEAKAAEVQAYFGGATGGDGGRSPIDARRARQLQGAGQDAAALSPRPSGSRSGSPSGTNSSEIELMQ
jgi:uncharacterized protein (DUF58 family)